MKDTVLFIVLQNLCVKVITSFIEIISLWKTRIKFFLIKEIVHYNFDTNFL